MSQVLRILMAPGMEVPRYATEGSAGFDLCARLDEPLTVAPGERVSIPTGLHVALPRGHEMQVRSRSGLASKHGIVMVNGLGTVDEDYRGEVRAVLVNHGREPYTIQPGDRIAQAVVAPVTRVDMQPVASLDELGTTERGAGGFGSTGR
jgi:dUTP pyrophosphatase